MGCSSFDSIRDNPVKIPNINEENINNRLKESIKEEDFYDNEILFKILKNYIKFYKRIFKENIKDKIYLVQTNFFRHIFKILFKELKIEELSRKELKEKIY